jgi:hypothetical protein
VFIVGVAIAVVVVIVVVVVVVVKITIFIFCLWFYRLLLFIGGDLMLPAAAARQRTVS